LVTSVRSYVRRHHVALLALFIALSGTAYAAAKINGTQIRRGSIPANRLKNDSVTGKQVREATLGLVPGAANSDALGGTPASSYLKSIVLRHSAGAPVANAGFGNATAQCDPGERAVAGGVTLGSGNARITDDAPSIVGGSEIPNAWFGQAHGDAGSDTIQVYVMCSS
jgi:hypothetical protein